MVSERKNAEMLIIKAVKCQAYPEEVDALSKKLARLKGAIPIEALDDVTTDAFINALCCFIAIRGPFQKLCSDQGTNCVGAKNELKEALKELDAERIKVCELDIIFKFEKAYFILDEFLLGGELQETSKKDVLKAIEQADQLQEVFGNSSE
uniref:uncharacterized protein n=1 Tax=Myxine glutinosa TaxID=7769 RepID=UPI00358DED8D